MPKGIIIIELARVDNEHTSIISQNLRKVDFTGLTDPERRFLLETLKTKQVSDFESDHFFVQKRPDRARVYYRRAFAKSSIILQRRSKAQPEAYGINQMGSYSYQKRGGKSCLAFMCFKSLQLVYKLAKLALVLSFFIIMYILFFLSKLKWPDFGNKDDKKSKSDDDEGACCDCEQIEANNSQMEGQIDQALRSAESTQASGSAQMGADLLGLENAAAAQKRGVESERANPSLQDFDSKMGKDTNELLDLFKNKGADCNCNRLMEVKYEFKNYLRDLCKNHLKGCTNSFIDNDTKLELERINEYSRRNELPDAEQFSNKVLHFLRETENLFNPA